MVKRILLGCVCVLVLAAPVFADKSSVEIEAPQTAVVGSEIVIRLRVAHSGNNFIHHTSWAYLNVNGKEVGRWEYPFENERFVREVKVIVTGNMEIEGMADCNLHGSVGKKTMTVRAGGQ